MSLKSKKKKTAVSPLVRGSAAAGAAAQARAKKSTVKQSVQKAAAKIQPAKAAASKAPVAKKKTTATSGRNDAAVRQSYGQRAGTRTATGAYKPTQSAAYNYKKAETKRSTISTDIKNQTKVKTQKPSVVSGPVKESRDNRDKRMRQSWSQRHPDNQVQREQRNEKQRPKSYVPTKGMATPTTKNTGKKSEWAEFEEGYNKAGILSPNERTGIAQGPLKDRAPLNTSQVKDIDTMLSGGTVPGMYIPDDKKPSALEYNIRMTGKDALSKPYAEEIWKNASVADKAKILKAATETVGFNEQTRRWSDEFQREYGLTPSGEKVKILGQDKPGLGELMYSDAYDKYKSAVKQQEYVDKWVKDHGYGTSDYMADATNLATATADVGLMNLSYLPLKDITNIERKPGDYFLGGVKAPYEGVSSNKSAFQNLATISNNIVGSVRSIIELPFKGAYYGINKINPDTDRYVDDFIATHNNVDLINRDRDEMIMRMNSAVNAGLVGKKTQVAGNIEGFILQQIPAIATMIAAGPEASALVGSTTFFGTTAGAYAQSALDSGASLEEAMNYGILGGIGEGATEMIFPMAKGIGGGLLKGGANTVNKRVLFGETVRELEKSGFANSMSGRILRSTIYNGGEATEEMIMEIIDPYLQRASFNPEAENASLAEIGMAGLYGAAVSAVLHIPMGVMNTAQGLTERHGLVSNARLYYAAKMREELIAIRGILEAGMITEEEAEQRTKEVRNKFAEKFAEAKTAIKQPWKATGSLLNEQTQGGEYKTSSNLEHLYSSRQEANAATVKPGTSAYFVEDGEVKRITHSEAGVKSEDAVLTNSEKTAYAEKAERLGMAKNNTERTGVQANVRQDIIDQASEMARVYNRNVEFYRDEEAAKRYDDRGRFDPKTETIYVNAATDKPLQTIISHEMVHAMRNTNAFKELLQEIKTYYKDSYAADVNDIRRMYSERDESGNVIEPSEGIIQEEVVAHFVEKKLLTDEAWVNTFLTNSRTDKILRGINTLLQRGLGGKEARFLASVRSKWLNALEEERGEHTAPRAEAVAAAKEMRHGRGRGYDGYSMSVNAREAYEDGEKPKSKWTKKDILDAVAKIDESKVELVKNVKVDILRDKLLYISSWHHTSKMYNKTNFYSIDESKVERLTKSMVESWTQEKKEATAPNTERGDFEYIEWSGTRKYPKATEMKLTDVNIEIKGSFYIVTDDNSNQLVRKKIGSNGTRAIFYSEVEKREKARQEREERRVTNSTEAANALYNELLKKGMERSMSGNIYERGRKPSRWDYEDGIENFFHEGEQRLSPNEDGGYQVETFTNGEWVSEEEAAVRQAKGKRFVNKKGIRLPKDEYRRLVTPIFNAIYRAQKNGYKSGDIISVYDGGYEYLCWITDIEDYGYVIVKKMLPSEKNLERMIKEGVDDHVIKEIVERHRLGIKESKRYSDRDIFSDSGITGNGRSVGRVSELADSNRSSDRSTDSEQSSGNSGSKVRRAKGSRDSEYLSAVERGDMKTAQRLVDEAAEEAGYTYHLYHGTNAEFTEFDVRKFGGKNGRANGYGIYLANNKTTAEQYGDNIIEAYVKFNRLAEGGKQTLTFAEVKNIVKKSCEFDAQQFIEEDEGYDSLEEALRDTWASNYVYTYDYQDMDQVYTDVANEILRNNRNDGDIINAIMIDSGKHSNYESAMDFYDEILTPTTGIDGFHYDFENNDIYIAFRSSQIKRADPITRDNKGKIIPPSERFDEKNDDIRYAKGQRRSSEAVETAKYHTKKLKYALYNRDRADNKELWDMLRAELNKAYGIGAYDPRVAEKIIDFAYRTGYQLEDNGNERFSLREKISIPEEYRGEMESLGGLAAVNRSIFGTGTVFTYKNNGIAIDEAYDEARDMRPDLFPETDNPSEQVQNIIDALTKVSDKIPLEELDREEDNPFEDSGDPIYNEIRDAVIAAMDDIAAIGRIDMVNRAKREGKNLSAKAQYRKGRESGKKQGQRSGYNTAKREQDRTDRATMREFDKLERQRAIDRAKQENQDRRDDEATMREFDNVMKKVKQDERKLSQQEKKELRKNYESREKDIRAEKNRLIHRLRVEKRSWQDAAERMESERKKQQRSLDTKQRQEMRKKQQKLDEERREERLYAALDAYEERKAEEKKGSAESLYKRNREVQSIIDEFRTKVLQVGAKMGAFKKEGSLLLDHNDVVIAESADGFDYVLKRDKNVVPSFSMTVLAEHEGMKKEDFYGIYAELQKMQNERDEKGNRVYAKRDILEYIVSLNIPASQKSFLYFDVMKYRYDQKPVFKDGGPTKIKPGNYFAGELGEAIDRIGLDMFTGAGVKLATDKSFQIKMENVDDLLDMMFTDAEMKEVARTELVQMIADFEADIEEARMIEQTNLLTDNPKEVDSRKLQILSVLRDSKKLFLAEGEAFERFADTVKNPLLAARYYAAKASMSIARDYINGHGIRKLDGTKEKVARTKQNGDEYDVEFVDEKLSLTSIMKPALKGTKESDALLKDLTRYVYAQHNIDRMKYDKGFMELSEEECRAIIDEIGKNKQVVKMADDLVLYGQRLLRLCVESGVISEEDFEYFTTKYPHYVPTFRLREDEVFDRNGNIVRRTNKVIKEAQKSNADLIPLYDQMVRRTQEIVKACKKNQLAAELVKAYNKDGAWDYIIDVRPAEPTSGNEDYIYGIGQIEDRGLKNRDFDGEDNLIPVYLNGVKYNIAVADKNLLYGWDRLNYYRDEISILKLPRKMNTLRRWVLTQYNPIFWATNGIKDSIDMYLYNQHAERLPLFQAKALSDIFHKKGHDSFAEYLSFGAASSSFFEYDERRRSKARKLKDKAAIPFKGIDFWNFLIEQWPRYTVYLEECDRLTKEREKGKNEYSDEEIKTISAYRAADATVNFGRSGTVVKAANTYGATFLNAGVQGMDRFRRMFTQVKGENKQETLINILGLMIKLAAVGLAPSMIADWLYGGNDDDEDKNKLLRFLFGEDAAKVVQEYAEMADYERTNYLNIKLPGMDGWIRIPKGRVVSFIYGWEYNGEKVLSGDMSAMDLLYTQWDLFAENIMPGNPLTNNILQPVLDVRKNRDFWGNEIVSQWEQAQDGFHWTESNEDTSIVARKIAEYLHYIVSGGKEMSPEYIDLSPIKIDYLLQQYGGSWTKLAQPFISAIGDGQDQRFVDMIQDAFKDSMWGKFYLDPVLSNRLAGDYYDLKDEYTGLSDYYGQDTPYAVALKGFKDHDEDLKALRDELNYVSKDASLTWKERLAKMREIREQMNDIYRVGVKDAKSILEYASDIYGGKDMNKDIYDAWQADTKGPDWVIDHMSDSAKVKWDTVKSEYSSADPQNFVDTYNYFSGLKGDKDENGKTVHDSKRQKFIQWLDNQPYSAAEKQSLYTQVGGYKTEATFKDGGSGTTKSNKDALKEKAEEIQANAKYMPVKEARISSEFGMRDHPISGKRKMHNGIDIAVGTGTDVVSARKGVVEFAGSRGGYGNRVVIDHGDGMKTTYSHLSEIGVKPGDTVNAGTLIAKSGDTGGVTGPHLHFEVEVNGSYVNPRDFFDFDSWKTVSIAKNPDYSAYAPTKSSGGGGGGGGRKSGGKKSGGSSGGAKGKATTQAAYTPTYAPTTTRSSGSSGSSSGGSSGKSSSKATRTPAARRTQTSVAKGIMLPTAREIDSAKRTSTPTVARNGGKSASRGIVLPTAAEVASAAAGARIGYGSGTSSIRRTNRSRGSFWNENILG